MTSTAPVMTVVTCRPGRPVTTVVPVPDTATIEPTETAPDESPDAAPLAAGPRRSWRVGLDAVAAAALLFASVGVVRAATANPAQALAALALLVAAALLWSAARRRPRALTAYLFFATTTLLTAVPEAAPFGALAVLVALALVGLDAGLAPALLLCGATGALLGVTILVTSSEPTSSAVLQGVGAGLLLAVVGGLGALLRRLEEAHATAQRQSAALAAANERLRAAIVTERELVLAQERARSARDLHDGLGHRLTLVAMSLQFAQRAREKDADRAWEEVARAAATTTEALDLMRLWARALNPPRPLPGLGGAAAFDAIADAFRGTGLAVSVTHEGVETSLPEPVGLFAVRLVQEALANTLRHAHATAVAIAVVQSPQQVRFTVRDNGTETVEVPEGFGLRSLRERAEGLGGQLASGPAPGGGWQVAAVLPTSGGQPTASKLGASGDPAGGEALPARSPGS